MHDILYSFDFSSVRNAIYSLFGSLTSTCCKFIALRMLTSRVNDIWPTLIVMQSAKYRLSRLFSITRLIYTSTSMFIFVFTSLNHPPYPSSSFLYLTFFPRKDQERMMRRLGLLYAWKRRCSACSDAHGASRRHFRFLDVAMSGAVIVLSGAAGVLALVDPHTQVLVGSMI